MESGSIILLKNQNIKIVKNERFILLRKTSTLSGAFKKFDAEKKPIDRIKKLTGFSRELEKASLDLL